MSKKKTFEEVKKILKLNLREGDEPVFSDEELQLLYESNNYSVSKTCWRACILKAETDDMIKVGSIEIKSSGKDYWLKLADMFYNDYQNELLNKNGSQKYKNTMMRVDEI